VGARNASGLQEPAQLAITSSILEMRRKNQHENQLTHAHLKKAAYTEMKEEEAVQVF